jgi:ubiquinone/menaquinone biosynthesis C-methylase UbiE
MTIYDRIGKDYSETRKSDDRLVRALLNILNSLGIANIVDIGAGTGSYAYALANSGYDIIAIEPSKVMLEQAVFHPKIKWIEAYAESLPLSDRSIDGAIIVLAMHHFANYRKALQEASRVTNNGSMIIFTYDPALIANFWLTDYFPALVTEVQKTFITIEQLILDLTKITKREINVTPFLLPNDLVDAFAAVGWSKPELYLNSKIRRGISAFSQIESTEIKNGLSHLQQDLNTGIWEQKYGHLRTQNYYDAGYRFVYTE